MSRLNRFLLCVCAGLGFAAMAQASPSDFRRETFQKSHTSISRQFLIHAPEPSETVAIAKDLATNLVKLDPALLAVSCERIKKSVLAELRTGDAWQGKISIVLHRSESGVETIVVQPSLQNGYWLYTVDMPDVMDRQRLIQTLTELLLLELANRGSDHSTEIPAWLSRGLAREADLSAPSDLVVEEPHTLESGLHLNRITRVRKNNQSTLDLHENFREMQPLDFERLSWPGVNESPGVSSESFIRSSQFFVHQLLELPDGRPAIRNFLRELPRHLNWQLAFYKAFAADFAGRRELDKWWDLSILQFTSRDAAQRWSSAVSRARLDQIVYQDVEVREGRDSLPTPSRVTIQSIISSWDLGRQLPLLKEKSRQFFSLQLSCSTDVLPLVVGYRNALDGYISKRENLANVQLGKLQPRLQNDDFSRRIMDDLNRLDAARNQSRPATANFRTLSSLNPNIGVNH